MQHSWDAMRREPGVVVEEQARTGPCRDSRTQAGLFLHVTL
jgi:hypothetical protein